MGNISSKRKSFLIKQKHKRKTKLKKLREKFVKDVIILLGYWPKGKPIKNPDLLLEEITERNINSVRVGKKLLS